MLKVEARFHIVNVWVKIEMDKPVSNLNRDDWVDAALKLLTDKGVDKVSIAALSRDLSVTKGSFYYHFKDRNDLLQAMLSRWQKTGTEKAIEAVERVGGDAIRRLRHMADITYRGFGAQLRLEFAIRDWGRKDDHVQSAIRQVDKRRMEYLRSLFTEIHGDPKIGETKAWLLYCLFNGENIIAGVRDNKSQEDVMWACLDSLVVVQGGA